jgi:hypothetical protein
MPANKLTFEQFRIYIRNYNTVDCQLIGGRLFRQKSDWCVRGQRLTSCSIAFLKGKSANQGKIYFTFEYVIEHNAFFI